MNKHFIILLILISGFIPSSIAQENQNEEIVDTKKANFSKRFFIAFATSTYLDLIVSPLKIHFAPTGNFDINGIPTYKDIPYQTQELNIVSLGIEPRYNLKEFDDNSSLSICVPISFGVGNSFSAASDNLMVRGINGFGSLQVPLLLKLSIGNGSTYTTQKDQGFNISAGFEINKIGLINLTNEPKEYNSAFIIPCFSAGYSFMRNDGPMEINFKFGFGPYKNQEMDGQGNSLFLAQRTTRAQTLKLTWMYLLNY